VTEIRNYKTGELIGSSDGSLKALLCELINSGVSLACTDLRNMDLTYATLTGADLRGADLRGADLRFASLENADLRGARFRGAKLLGAYLTGARLDGATGLLKAPKVPDLHRRLSSAVGRLGSHLDMGIWHNCRTTHCRAGWAIQLAGKAGKRLETKLGPGVAGALIYWNSTGMIPDFFAEQVDALADIRRCVRRALRAR
jgi:hypothetical protein